MTDDSQYQPHGAGHDGREAHARAAHADHDASAQAPPEHGGSHEAHAGHAPSAQAGLPERVRKLMQPLQEMRVLQAGLAREHDREMAAQRAHDALVQQQMQTDPRGHVETMRPLQERNALVRELPEALLRHETDCSKR